MRIGFEAENKRTADGVVTGGYVQGTGFRIDWQDGPLGRHPEGAVAPNGAFVEDVLDSCLQRLQAFQETRFACLENDMAIANLREALLCLDSRTQRRVEQGVEGTHEGS